LAIRQNPQSQARRELPGGTHEGSTGELPAENLKNSVEDWPGFKNEDNYCEQMKKYREEFEGKWVIFTNRKVPTNCIDDVPWPLGPHQK
jgi:hypothetical protein